MKFLAVLIVSVAVLVSCMAPTEPEPASESVPEVARAAPAGTRDSPYVGQGIIQEVSGNLLVISHGVIPEFMAAMTMAFPVAEEAMSEDLEAGDEIVFHIETLAEGYQIFSLEEVQSQE